MPLQTWLIQFGSTHFYLIYLVIFLVATLEGPILSVILGIILRLNHFSFILVYIILILGDLTGDVVWYYIGYHYGISVISRVKKWFGLTEERINKTKELFHSNTYKILFISKLTNGLGFAIPVLTTAGIVRVPFLKFMRINIAGQLFWSGGLLALGYFFGGLYSSIHSILGKSFLAGIVLIIGIVALQYIKRVRQTLE